MPTPLRRVTFFVEKPRRSSKVFKVVKEARWKNGCGTKDYVSLRKIWGSSSLSLSCGLIFPVTYRLYAIVDNTRGDEFCFSNPLGYGKGSVTFMFKWILSEVALKGGGTIRSEVDKVPIDGMFTPRISTVKVSIEAENLMVVVIFESVASPQPRLPILLVLRLRALRILVVLQGLFHPWPNCQILGCLICVHRLQGISCPLDLVWLFRDVASVWPRDGNRGGTRDGVVSSSAVSADCDWFIVFMFGDLIRIMRVRISQVAL
ncbi:hypothetical protein V6N12_008573 [Hibiscus sabdariffa]|uniref:Uncharacterized protein n=1 Tax=Hibiscus sabdariffa TaxID=183260 RepID=A0ABR2BJF2_9ROSI